MVVISGIKTAIKIAPVVYKVGKVVWKASLKTKRGGQWMTRHPKVVKYGTAAAGVGSLLLDLTNIDYDALIPKTVPGTGKNGQTRNYMEFPSSRSRYRYNYCPPSTRRTFRRQKRTY